MEAAGNDGGGDIGLFLASGLTTAEEERERKKEREREQEGERERRLASPWFLNKESECYSGAHSKAGAGPGGPEELSKMQLPACCSQGPCNFDMEIRQAPRKESDEGLAALLDAEHPVQHGVGEGRGQWGQDGGKPVHREPGT